jgi:hypothetical protein
MSKELPTKTMEIPVMLQEVDTAEDALEHEKLKAGEEIEGLRKFYKEGVISHDQMEVAIKEVRERLRKLKIDNEILK